MIHTTQSQQKRPKMKYWDLKKHWAKEPRGLSLLLFSIPLNTASILDPKRLFTALYMHMCVCACVYLSAVWSWLRSPQWFWGQDRNLWISCWHRFHTHIYIYTTALLQWDAWINRACVYDPFLAPAIALKPPLRGLGSIYIKKASHFSLWMLHRSLQINCQIQLFLKFFWEVFFFFFLASLLFSFSWCALVQPSL